MKKGLGIIRWLFAAAALGSLCESSAAQIADSIDLGKVIFGAPVVESVLLCDTCMAPLVLESIGPIVPPLLSVKGIQAGDTIFSGDSCRAIQLMLEMESYQDTLSSLQLNFRSGCFASKIIRIHLSMYTLGVLSAVTASDFSLRPNPATGENIILKFGKMETASGEVEITNTLGAGVFDKQIIFGGSESEQIEIPLGNLQNGIYYARLRSGGRTITRKFEVLR